MIPLVKSNASFLRRVELLVTQCPFMSPLLRCSSVALVLINFFLGSSRSVATDYYVSPAGHKSTCTLAQPWATIAKGISTAGAGDTVFVRAGTYAEKLNLNGKSVPRRIASLIAITPLRVPSLTHPQPLALRLFASETANTLPSKDSRFAIS